jgi:hypothetical protein
VKKKARELGLILFKKVKAKPKAIKNPSPFGALSPVLPCRREGGDVSADEGPRVTVGTW